MTPSTTDSLALAATIARRPPATEFVYEAVVDIGERVSIGQAPLGERFIVPIIGGVFKGADIEGVVLPGGADRQLVRRDGVPEGPDSVPDGGDGGGEAGRVCAGAGGGRSHAECEQAAGQGSGTGVG